MIGMGEWYRTGDQAVVDEDGYLRLIGRMDEIINRGGKKNFVGFELPNAAGDEMKNPKKDVVVYLEADTNSKVFTEKPTLTLSVGGNKGVVVPIENSVEGSVSVTLDELANGDRLVIVDEVVIPVRFALMARPGVGLAQITKVATHPHAQATQL